MAAYVTATARCLDPCRPENKSDPQTRARGDRKAPRRPTAPLPTLPPSETMSRLLEASPRRPTTTWGPQIRLPADRSALGYLGRQLTQANTCLRRH